MADKNNTTISLCVDKVLDHVGASEQIRRNHVEKAMVDEVVTNLTMPILENDDIRFHNFGSWCEGTTTKGLNSDIDIVFYYRDILAIEKIPDGSKNDSLKMIDWTTKPGYVKLQLVDNGIPIIDIATPYTEKDQFGRVCLSRDTRSWKNVFDIPMFIVRQKRTGPAVTFLGNPDTPDIDHVSAYRCYGIPSFTIDWIHRPRKYGWPSQQQLNNMSSYGCFLVGKGHPSSQTEHLEWRISFSFQERELMFSLNMTQHKCYILLKMIKQALVSKTNVKSISSYHLKTSLFYTIENNPTHIWIPENIVYCTELCLKQLLGWLNNENSPNFFVPEENMFDRLSSDVMKKTATFIRDMLDSDVQYLMLLTCDKFGELLQQALSGKVLPDLSREAIELDLKSRLRVLRKNMHLTNRIVTVRNRNCALETLNELQSLLEQLRKSEERLTSEKVFRGIKQGVSLILPTIHLHIAQTIAAIMVIVAEADKKRELMQEFNHHIEQANALDIISHRLVKASLMFKQKELEECERILSDCETSLKDCILPMGSCTNTYSDDKLKNLIEIVQPASLTLLDLRKYVTPCLMFLPSQSDLAPTPLQYEMYRSVGASTDTVHTDFHYWYGCIGIDANLYLFFLQYVVYSKLNKHDLAAGVMLKLNSMIETRSISHMETCCNVFGWICKHENVIELATKFFYMSWKIRPDHNAAKWHMLVMMYEQYVQRSKR